MIQFNELQLDTATDTLIVDVAVKTLSYYSNVYIKAIHITTEDYYTAGIPDIKIYTHVVENGEELKTLRLEIKKSELTVADLNHLFFVYVETVGTPSPDAPCGADSSLVVGFTYNRQPLYDKALCFISKLDDKCTIHKDFLDFMLKVDALEYAFKTSDFTEAIYYFKKFFATKTPCSTVTNLNCNCHG